LAGACEGKTGFVEPRFNPLPTKIVFPPN